MKKTIKFDETARAERYFVATLLAHWLLTDNFTGLRKLFSEVFGAETCAGLQEQFEVVSELDPLRDSSVYHDEVKKLYLEFRRVAVPDLFLRWDHLCLVIEAKFFTDPTSDDLHGQVYEQRRAIKKVKQFTHYADWDIRFALLTVAQTKASLEADVTYLNWETVLGWMDANQSCSNDMTYTRDILRNALNRAREELNKGKGISFEKLTFKEILARLSQLVEQRKVYIGFTGGVAALHEASLDELVSRSHYKISDNRWSDNWLTLDVFLRRVFELEGYR